MNSPAALSLNFSWVLEDQLAGCAAPMLDEDLMYLYARGIRALVRLAYPDKDDFVIDAADVEAAGFDDLLIPVEDFHAPTPEQIDNALEFVSAHLKAGKPVAVSCGAGCGRTGTILACYLVTHGYNAADALRLLISKRPCSDEILTHTPTQKAAIYDFEQRFKTMKSAPRPKHRRSTTKTA